MSLLMFGKALERVNVFRFLGILFDSKLTWDEHIKKVMEKCQKVINIIRCLSGVERRASLSSLKIVYVAMVSLCFIMAV